VAAYGACLAALGYLDLVALAVVTGHAAGVAVRWRRDRDHRLFWFMSAVVAGLAACLRQLSLQLRVLGLQSRVLRRPPGVRRLQRGNHIRRIRRIGHMGTTSEPALPPESGTARIPTCAT
jgi:hypothetical protein